MKNWVNSGEAKATAMPILSQVRNFGKVQRLSRRGVGDNASEKPRTLWGRDIVQSPSKGGKRCFKNVLAQVGQNASTKTGILSSLMSSTASSLCANTGTNSNSRQFGFPAVFGTSASRLSAVSKTAPSISARLGPIAVRKAVTVLRRKSAEPMADGSYAAIASPQALSTMYGNPDRILSLRLVTA